MSFSTDTTGCISHDRHKRFLVLFEDYLDVARVSQQHRHKLAAFWRILETKTNDQITYNKRLIEEAAKQGLPEPEITLWIEIPYSEYVNRALGFYKASAFQIAAAESERLGFSSSRLGKRPRNPADPDSPLEDYKEYLYFSDRMQSVLDGGEYPTPIEKNSPLLKGIEERQKKRAIEKNTPPIDFNSPNAKTPIDFNRGVLLKSIGNKYRDKDSHKDNERIKRVTAHADDVQPILSLSEKKQQLLTLLASFREEDEQDQQEVYAILSEAGLFAQPSTLRTEISTKPVDNSTISMQEIPSPPLDDALDTQVHEQRAIHDVSDAKEQAEDILPEKPATPEQASNISHSQGKATSKGKLPKKAATQQLTLQGQHIIDFYQQFKGRKVTLNDENIKAANGLGDTVECDEDFNEVLIAIKNDKFLKDHSVRIDLDFVYRKYDGFLDKVDKMRALARASVHTTSPGTTRLREMPTAATLGSQETVEVIVSTYDSTYESWLQSTDATQLAAMGV